MEQELKQRILGNPFVDDLLSHTINESAYSALCRAFADLAIVWRDQRLIEKDVILDLYTTVTVIRNKIAHFSSSGQPNVGRLEDMLIELDRLISEECLYSTQ